MKTCARCKMEKPEAQFTRDAARQDGLNPYCFECTRLYGREYYAHNKEKVSVRSSRWHKANPEKSREKTRRHKQKNREYFRNIKKAAYSKNKDQITALLRDNAFRKKFGISLAERNEMADAQEKRCLICGKHESYLTKRLAVDHDHETLTVRGLLCQNCNLGLGYFLDDPDLLRSAAIYLERIRKPKEEIA